MRARRAWSGGVSYDRPSGLEQVRRAVGERRLGLAHVRPAWAHSWRCKSSPEQITAREVNRNCVRATDRGKEARSVNREPMNKNCIEGAVEQGERA